MSSLTMILTKLVLKTIKAELDALGYSNYLYVAPQDAVYPFVTFFPVSDTIEYTFGQVLEYINIQLTIYSEGSDCLPLLTMSQAIEEAMDELSASEGGYTIFCTHRTNEIGPEYLETEHYWQSIIELEFMTYRDKV